MDTPTEPQSIVVVAVVAVVVVVVVVVVPLPYPFFLFETSKQPLRFGGETIKQRLVAKNSVKAVKTR